MSKLKEKLCIVCGVSIWWNEPDSYPLPPACSEHPYEKVFMVYDNKIARNKLKKEIKDANKKETKSK